MPKHYNIDPCPVMRKRPERPTYEHNVDSVNVIGNVELVFGCGAREPLRIMRLTPNQAAELYRELGRKLR